MKEVPGAVYHEDAYWSYPLSWASCVALREVLGDELEVGEELVAWARQEQERAAAATAARAGEDGPEFEIDDQERPLEGGTTDEAPPMDYSKEWWWELWQGMPEYAHSDVSPWRTVKVHFRSRADLEDFEKRIGQKVTKFPVGTGTIWHPAGTPRGKEWRYVDES